MQAENALAQMESSSEQVTDKVMAWLSQAVEMLPNLAIAVLTLLVFYGLAKLLARVTHRGLARMSHNQEITGLATTVVRVLVLAIGAVVALSVLQLDKTVTSMLAGLGVLGLALGFAFQDILSNFMAGIILAFRRPFEVGEVIESNDVLGTVSELKLSATLLRNFQGQDVWIPNTEVLQSTLTNYTRSNEWRVELDVSCSYDDDLARAEETCRRALTSLDFRHPDKDVDVWFTGFGSSSIDMSARVWIEVDGPANFLVARSEMVKAIKAHFDRAGLTIPFPIRTMDFGMTGDDSTLRDHLSVLRGTGQGDRRSNHEAAE